MALALFAHRRTGKLEAEEALHPDEAWMLEKKWAERCISSQTGASAVVLALFGTV